MRVIRRTSFKASAWKNGGGITYEAVRDSAGGEPFKWRLSVAQIDNSGPFSDFTGFHRTMVLLQGDGVELIFESEGAKRLIDIGDMVEFDGSSRTECRLLNGPCTDLNFMASKSLQRANARVENVLHALHLKPERGVTLVFAIGGNLCVDPAEGPADVLERWDVALIPMSGGVIRPALPLGGSSMVFLAMVDDTSR